jgi:ribosome-associated translation inhibitor RaiA
MKIPLQIHFGNLGPSDFIEAAVRKHANKLERFRDDIMSCRVTIESPHKHQQKGHLFHIVINVRTEGDEIVVSRTPDDEQSHEDVYVAIRDAFNAARRQLQDRLDMQRGFVKRHETPEPPLT